MILYIFIYIKASNAQVIVFHPRSDAQLAPQAAEEGVINSLPSKLLLNVTWYGISVGQFKSGVPILFPPSSLSPLL